MPDVGAVRAGLAKRVPSPVKPPIPKKTAAPPVRSTAPTLRNVYNKLTDFTASAAKTAPTGVTRSLWSGANYMATSGIPSVYRTLQSPMIGGTIDLLRRQANMAKAAEWSAPSVIGPRLATGMGLLGAFAQVAQFGGSVPNSMRTTQRQGYIDWARGRTARNLPASSWKR